MEPYQVWLICACPIVFAAFTLYAYWKDSREKTEEDADKAFSRFVEAWIDEVEKRGK